MVEREHFVTVMRRAATGVTVVTTDGRAGRFGVTVSAMCSVSVEPPSVLACMHGASPVVEAARRNGCFCVNVLRGAQSLIADCFAGRIEGMRDDRFACADWSRLATGAPVLADALASFDCWLTNEVAFGSHRILLGTVEACAGRDGDALVYSNCSYGIAAPAQGARG